MDLKVSLILPIYNKEPYIEKCLYSILNQSYQNFEIIVINDGSTDSSADIISKIAQEDNRIRFRSYPNGGVSKARNLGLQQATGEYIMFIDSDDYIDANYLESFVNIAKVSNCDIVIGGITYVYRDGSRKVIRPYNLGLFTKKTFLSQFVEEQYNKNVGLYGYVPNKLIKRSLIESNKIYFNQNLKKWEDYDFYLSCYNKCNDVYCIAESGYYYLCDTINSSSALIKDKDYQSLINTHIKCLTILETNCVTNEKAYNILHTIIADSYIASFLCMKPIKIDYISSLLHNNYKAEKLINNTSYKKTIFRYFISNHCTFGIYFYLVVWNTYLFIRQKLI